MLKFSEHNAKKIRLKIPYRYREIVKKNEAISLSYDVNDLNLFKVKINLISCGFSQYRSYTVFGIKLDRFIRILAWSFD